MNAGSRATATGALFGNILPSGAGPHEICLAADGAFFALLGNLARWVGDEGARILMERALDDVRAGGHPWLAGVRVHPSDGRCLEGFASRVEGRSAEEVSGAMEMLLTSLVSLLAKFIGNDLATRIVIRGWPAGPPVVRNGEAG